MFVEQVENRVDRLEELMAELITQSKITQRQLNQTDRNLSRLEIMVEKTQVQVEKTQAQVEKTQVQVEKTQAQVEETSKELTEFKEWAEQSIKEDRKNLTEFKEWVQQGSEHDREKMAKLEEWTERSAKEDRKKMAEFKEWVERGIKEDRKKWGELANKMGTLVEDIFVPSIDIALKKAFDYDYVEISSNRLRRKEGRGIEIDILVETTTKQVVIVEVKANPNRQDYIDLFKKKLNDFLHFFPEYEHHEIIPIYAALNIHEDIINLLTKNKIYAMVMRGDMLEVVNLKRLQK